jgi:hypothetical protein
MFRVTACHRLNRTVRLSSQVSDNRHNYPVVWTKLDKEQPVIGALRELSLWNGVLAQLEDVDFSQDKPN